MNFKKMDFQASVDATSDPLGVYTVALGSRLDVQPGHEFSFARIIEPLLNRSFEVAHVGAEPKLSCGITASSCAILAFSRSISLSCDRIRPEKFEITNVKLFSCIPLDRNLTSDFQVKMRATFESTRSLIFIYFLKNNRSKLKF